MEYDDLKTSRAEIIFFTIGGVGLTGFVIYLMQFINTIINSQNIDTKVYIFLFINTNITDTYNQQNINSQQSWRY